LVGMTVSGYCDCIGVGAFKFIKANTKRRPIATQQEEFRMSHTIIAAPALLAALWCFSAPANAQTQSDLAKECLAALNTGDSTRANQIAEEIKTWPFVFSTQLKAEALECLEGASGEQWTYSTELGRFLSAAGTQRQLEEDRLETQRQLEEDRLETQRQLEEDRLEKKRKLEALRLETERKWKEDRLEAERKQEKQRELLARKCTLKDEISQFELTIGEAERLSQQRQNQAAKQIERVQAEAQVETVRICTEWYEEDKRGAVTDLVCNKIFLTIGLPDTELSLLVDATQSGPTYDELNAAISGLAAASSDLSIIELYGMSPEDHYAQELKKSAQSPSKEPEADECAYFK
jgi:hypothetical protein